MATDNRSASGEAKSYQRLAIEAVIAARPAGDPAKALYEHADVQQTLARFEAADTAALKAQARYRRWKQRGLRATTFGVMLGALLLLPFDLPRVTIGALQTLALLTTFTAIVVVTKWRPLDTWMASRAKAERLRGRIFERIVNAPGGGAAADAASAKLDIVMRAYIEDQIRFFNRRTGEHKRRASEISPLRLLGYLVILIAFGIGLVVTLSASGIKISPVSEWLERWIGLSNSNRWQLALTTAASGILSYSAARTLMDEDSRKAALYGATAKKLERLIAREHPAAVAFAASGDQAAVAAFFARARTVLEQEHAVWSFVHDVEDEDEDARAAATKAR